MWPVPAPISMDLAPKVLAPRPAWSFLSWLHLRGTALQFQAHKRHTSPSPSTCRPLLQTMEGGIRHFPPHGKSSSPFSSNASLLEKPLPQVPFGQQDHGVITKTAHGGLKWRPWTLHPVSFGSIVLCSSGVLALLEYLVHKSNRENGIAFPALTTGEFITGQLFLFLYFPTVLAIIYSIWVSWLGLDIKRLEPWYQLIRPNPPKFDNSLLLQYPVEFLALVPFKAARRRSAIPP
jgi:Protein of unknown function (DUF3433)